MSVTPLTPEIPKTARLLALDFYLSALLAPRDVKNDLITFAAFLGEIESISEKVSEPLIGEIRIQWWRDWLSNLDANQSTGVPLADAMSRVVERHNLPSSLLLKMLDSQTTHLNNLGYASTTEFFLDLEGFYGSVFQLLEKIMAPNAKPNEAKIHLSAARAYATAHLLTRMRAHAATGHWPFPSSVAHPPPPQDEEFAQQSLAVDQQRAHERRQSICEAIDAALLELHKARQQIARLPKPSRLAFLPLALVEPYFKAFERGTGDPLLMRIEISPLSRRWTLWRASH